MNKPAAIHADLTAAQIQERIDALTAKLLALRPMPVEKSGGLKFPNQIYTFNGKLIAK